MLRVAQHQHLIRSTISHINGASYGLEKRRVDAKNMGGNRGRLSGVEEIRGRFMSLNNEVKLDRPRESERTNEWINPQIYLLPSIGYDLPIHKLIR